MFSTDLLLGFWRRAAFVLMLALPASSASAQKEYTVGEHPSPPVWSVAFAPDGRTFAAVQVNLVRLYETATGKLLRTIVSKSKKDALARFEPTAFGPVADLMASVDFSPDGKLLAGARFDATACLWKTTGTEAPAVLEAHDDCVRCCRFSPDGALLATGSQDASILLWDVSQQKVKVSLRGHDSWVLCVAFSADGKLLASGMEGGKVELWDVARRKSLRIHDAGRGGIRSLAFSPDAKVLLSGDQDKEIKTWDVATGDSKGILRGHTETVNGLHVLRDNRTVISAGEFTVRAWDLERQTQIGVVRVPPWHSLEAMAVSPDQKNIICGQTWGTVQLIKMDRLLHAADRSKTSVNSPAEASGRKKE